VCANVAPDLRFLGRFALRRSIRLDPPYWASIILVIAVAAVSARVQNQSYAFPDASNVAAHFVYLQRFLGYPDIA
jgi:peptidoglycan/LPS O-acetylase OafA/YrhL